MSEQTNATRMIEEAKKALREYRHQILGRLCKHGPSKVEYLDTDETDEIVRGIDKAIKHLYKAKKIIERPNK